MVVIPLCVFLSQRLYAAFFIIKSFQARSSDWCLKSVIASLIVPTHFKTAAIALFCTKTNACWRRADVGRDLRVPSNFGDSHEMNSGQTSAWQPRQHSACPEWTSTATEVQRSPYYWNTCSSSISHRSETTLTCLWSLETRSISWPHEPVLRHSKRGLRFTRLRTDY